VTYLEMAKRLHDGRYWRITDAPLTRDQYQAFFDWSIGGVFFQSLRHRMYFVLLVAAAEGEL
jgi:hypothetical protein